MAPLAAEATAFGSIVGADLRMRQLFTLLEEVAATNATVLVEGETGTGKELIAEEIHRHSPRRNGPFVVFDCSTVPRDRVASILFGHLKGSFTGATSDRRGIFAEASGGTVFLDEIGEMELALQPALLRALDKRAVCRVGATVFEPFDVRVVAATQWYCSLLIMSHGSHSTGASLLSATRIVRIAHERWAPHARLMIFSLSSSRWIERYGDTD